MNLLKNKSLLPVLALCGLVSACSSSNDDDADDMDNSMATGFAFATDAPADYAIFDRVGMPAIATALIASKDDYNASTPVDDVAGKFVPEIVATLDVLHAALDDDLTGLGITPCTTGGEGTCVAAAAPNIIPDTIKIDTAAAAGFPNGRLLTDPVIDVTLALALIELTGDTAQTATSLVGALNPVANDVEFSAEFPFLAAPF